MSTNEQRERSREPERFGTDLTRAAGFVTSVRAMSSRLEMVSCKLQADFSSETTFY
jgi:hypothetical protein